MSFFYKKKTHKIWSAFLPIRQDRLPSIWKGFLWSIDVEDDPLLQQSVNQKLFVMLLSEHLKPTCSSQRRPASEDVLMSKDGLTLYSMLVGMSLIPINTKT